MALLTNLILHRGSHCELAYHRYQMYVDDLPIWALVGDHGEGGGVSDEDTYIWTHKRFDFGVHGNQVRVDLLLPSYTD